tara:strand:+ start:528 stop:1055 length:528 start_codon:yes stop_codon:yes gene_type:complete
MSAVARKIQYNTQVIPYNLNSITPTSIVFEEFTKSYSSTTENVIDSDIKKSYGCNSFIDVTANQVNDKWFSVEAKHWDDTHETWNLMDNKNWDEIGEDLTTSGEQLNSSSTALVFGYFKNIGSNPILLSNDGGSNYLFKISVGSALYFKASGINVNSIYAKSSTGTTSIEFMVAI